MKPPYEAIGDRVILRGKGIKPPIGEVKHKGIIIPSNAPAALTNPGYGIEEVLSVGPDCKSLKPGDFAVIMPAFIEVVKIGDEAIRMTREHHVVAYRRGSRLAKT